MIPFSWMKAVKPSKAMAKEASQYTRKPFTITPFGVDCELFSPDKTPGKRYDAVNTKNGRDYVIGTVKSLSDKYGIATLLRATALLKKQHPEVP